MNEIIRKITDYIAEWKEWREMSVEDKILLVMEGICYFFAMGTLIAFIYAIDNGFIAGAMILLLGSAGLILCGLNAMSSRDSHIGEWRLSTKTYNKRINKLLKWN